MDYLQQLARVVESNTTTPVFFNSDLPDNMLFQRLYKGILSGVYHSDSDAARDIYKKTSLYGPYRSLKTELCRRLENLLFFVHFGATSSRIKKARYKCRRSLFIAWTLMEDGAMEAAGTIAYKTLGTAKQYDLSRQALECIEILRLVSASQGDKKKFQRYSELHQKYSLVFDAEQKVQRYLDEIYLHLSRSTNGEEGLVEVLEQYCKECDQYRLQFDTYMITMTLFRLQVYSSHLTRNYQQALQACSKLEDFLNRKSIFDSSTKRGEIILQKNACRLHLRDYQVGLQEASQGIYCFPTGSDNWFAFQQSYFLLALHSKEYTRAHLIYHDVFEKLQHTSIFQRQKLWHLYKEYLNIAEGRVLHPNSLHEAFTDDKAGMNIPLLLRNIVEWLQKGDYEILMNKDESLRKYEKRYIQPERDRRTSIFILMIRTLLREECNYTRTVAATSCYVEELGKIGSSDLIEILPYEMLWQYILSLLPNKKTAP